MAVRSSIRCLQGGVRVHSGTALYTQRSDRSLNINRNLAADASRRSLSIAFTAAMLSSLQDSSALSADTSTDTAESPLPRQVFLDLSVDGKPLGRVAIEIFDDVPVGGQRFFDLTVGKEGIRYQSSKIIKITDKYIEDGGVRRLALIEGAESPIAGGSSLQELLAELDTRRHSHDSAGVVSLVLKKENLKLPKKKLVAVKGKFEVIEEGGGVGPNGTGFVITTAADADLDASNLVIGKVTSGMEVVEAISKLPTAKDNTGSVFYRAAKQFGDPRADVAQLSFNKPFNRITVSSGGTL